MTTELQGIDQDQLTGAVQAALDEAKLRGASAAEAGVSVDSGLSVTVRMGDVETVEHHRDQGMGVTVYFGQHKGSASTSDLSLSAIRESVEAACGIAKYTAADEFSGLADARLMATEFPDLDLYHPWSIDADRAIEIALQCEQSAMEHDARIGNSEGAGLHSHQGVRIYGNSHGFMGVHPSSRHSVDCAVIAQEDDAMERDFWYTAARDSADLNDVSAVGRTAAERTVRRLGARQLKTCQAPVLYSADIARGLIGHYLSAIRGGALYRKATFLLDHLGKQVFPDYIQLIEQPHLHKGLASASFDNEGVATQECELVKNGVVQTYVLDSYSARKLGMETTGHAGGVHNLYVTPGDVDFDGLLQQMDRGLLVTELMGHGVNVVTGDYSRGATGFWVEDGQIAYPVHEITIAGNLCDMFANIVAVGSDVDTLGSIHTGSILVEQMTIAGE